MRYILFPILILLILSYYFLIKHAKPYDKKFGIGSAKFVQGELIMFGIFMMIFLVISLSYTIN